MTEPDRFGTPCTITWSPSTWTRGVKPVELSNVREAIRKDSLGDDTDSLTQG